MRKALVLAGAATLLFAAAKTSIAAPDYATPIAPLSSALPSLGAPVMTPRGMGVVTGNMGSMGMVSMPGTGGQALLMNNGNGTSTLIGPNFPAQIVMTPR
ncbi:MAG TPA: hypothetical protein VMB34_08180 [Acetobacteraceae bacterium]|nr:hypothetical protein [Acetobacteraceae bacterium]